MDRNPIQETLAMLAPLIGTWKGRGRGEYPTIDDFHYLENLTIRQAPGTTYLTYEQSTDLVDAEGTYIRKTHWEAGLLRPREDGGVELANIQAGGRVEVLEGAIVEKSTAPGKLQLVFSSKMIGNDERMVSSRREWRLDGNEFAYMMHMATTKVADPSIHLTAILSKE